MKQHLISLACMTWRELAVLSSIDLILQVQHLPIRGCFAYTWSCVCNAWYRYRLQREYSIASGSCPSWDGERLRCVMGHAPCDVV